MLALLKATIIALISASTALPTSTNPQTRSIAPNAQSCTAKSCGPIVHYKINIGIPYNEDSCDAVSNKLYSNGAEQVFSSYMCDQIEEGFTEVKFNYLMNKAGKINEAMGRAFPEVNGFNCPDY
ncbi:hypothetical protein M409DRAFT_27810 [Zasmidium cellare ATCC 36951]|uniref:Uncharacterized protein n=1 Tax=Zasmidium cellare ATCC 36951 TaxID=1080233 RepID=A0A6A6C3R5_ZASCE|nr:uncharacterized protein M409DRAFT_27810 [Zasmidium cellare ATCC 36951]KAF2161754.1 hypothetical protein M409DRAFT_27810 [Zasmidium cellare ATCC 36951]